MSIVALALAFGVVACHHRERVLAGSSRHSFHGSVLITEHQGESRTGRKIALLHVLFVREVPPNERYFAGTASGGSVDHYELGVQFFQWGNKNQLTSQRVTIEKSETVQAGGKSFSLAQGNLFVAMVRPDGSIDLSQVPHVEQDIETSPESILATIKAANRQNPRIQAVS